MAEFLVQKYKAICQSESFRSLTEVCKHLEETEKTRELVLNASFIKPPDLKPMLAALVGWPGLQKLSLSRNPLGDRGAIFIGRFIGQSTGLKVLELEGCGIGDRGGAAIFRSAAALEELNLSANRLGPQSMPSLAGALGGAGCALRVLKLASNRIRDSGVAHLFPALFSNRSLESVNLIRNELGFRSATRFLELLRLSECPLMDLRLEYNSVGTKQLEELREALGLNRSIMQEAQDDLSDSGAARADTPDQPPRISPLERSLQQIAEEADVHKEAMAARVSPSELQRSNFARRPQPGAARPKVSFPRETAAPTSAAAFAHPPPPTLSIADLETTMSSLASSRRIMPESILTLLQELATRAEAFQARIEEEKTTLSASLADAVAKANQLADTALSSRADLDGFSMTISETQTRTERAEADALAAESRLYNLQDSLEQVTASTRVLGAETEALHSSLKDAQISGDLFRARLRRLKEVEQRVGTGWRDRHINFLSRQVEYLSSTLERSEARLREAEADAAACRD
eukprot:gnl/Chilomastix_cuspidata/4476.p1 GENE.gnl/Chilomastix_cuspidata/4476~~gnl/Chilomastix_cuspidata/4476.p1  ORF type:complete len:521 (-),score=225.13 gnl/Chilomastix_cuspidata/4476:132-1694(-)